ncbi:uncharacterized protein LOC135211393 [Macrobrachium nipponense]|uniref:uncharacterized protein LOC135211393 n=1 Tax=Macrobrachium nipponense TaxID=159736 RepID=UPI0030C7CF15
MSDNTTVVAYMNCQGGTESLQLCQLAVQIHECAVLNLVMLTARFIPEKQNIVVDNLSRRTQIVGSEWSLAPQIVNKVWTLWGSPTIDLFVTSLNWKLPIYCFPVPDPAAAFSV